MDTRTLLVADFMTIDPIVVAEDAPLEEAARLVREYSISGLPVVDDSGALVGVISETDLLHARTTDALWRAREGLTVQHLMTHPAVAVMSDVSIEHAAHVMEDRRIHRLVVVDTDGETPIGVLSVSDLVRSMGGG